ncbi:MAG: TrkA family potassium uptake protein [Planctomycetes bacterium]|nr:TrkA family potassium uptake protein [Planctomycetota bacterium]
MSQRFLVIGLGQFGTSVARGLARRGMDVTAVDRSEDKVKDVSLDVARAVVADATDERALAELRVEAYSAAVNAIGAEFLEGSILCTALLRQLGARRIIARAKSKLHERILTALGVDRVVQPESLMGDRLASELASPGLMGQLDLAEGVTAIEVAVPEAWVGRTLADLNLRRRIGVTVVALQRPGAGGRMALVPGPPPDQPLQRGEVALVIGTPAEVEQLLKEIR